VGSRALEGRDDRERSGFSFGTGIKSGWLAIDASLRHSTAAAQVSRFPEAEEVSSGNRL
jgi:hypothetical protein